MQHNPTNFFQIRTMTYLQLCESKDVQNTDERSSVSFFLTREKYKQKILTGCCSENFLFMLSNHVCIVYSCIPITSLFHDIPWKHLQVRTVKIFRNITFIFQIFCYGNPLRDAVILTQFYPEFEVESKSLCCYTDAFLFSSNCPITFFNSQIQVDTRGRTTKILVWHQWISS